MKTTKYLMMPILSTTLLLTGCFFSSSSSTKTKTKFELEETFMFDDLELRFSSDYSFTKVENQYSEYHEMDTVRLPVTVTNKDDETNGLNYFYITAYGPDGLEAKDVDAFFDDSILYSSNVLPGATYTTNLYFLYKGNGKYTIELHSFTSKKLQVIFDLVKR